MQSEPPSSAATALRMPVDVRRFGWIRRLAADYAYNFARVAPFFAGDPSARDSWVEAISRAQAHPRRRDEVAAMLVAQQRRRDAPSPAIAAAERLREPRTVAIVTGQQAGLFGGPLFTLLKAITALKIAQHVGREYGVPASAVFWIDAEDHDWDEVRGCGVLDADLQFRTIQLAALPGAAETSVASVALDESIDRAIAELSGALAGTEFTSALLQQLRTAYRPGVGMADAFGRWLESVLGAHGLVVFDSSDPAAKPLASPVFERELQNPGRTAALAAEAGVALAASGYHAQVTPLAESVALFYLDHASSPLRAGPSTSLRAGGRRSIRRRGADLAVGDTTTTAEALLRELATKPASFSPNVLLRPVVQDTLLPTVCYVAGPSELSYLAQLHEVYRQFGVPMPLVVPRASATIIDAAGARFLTKYELPLEAFQPQDEAALNRLLEAQLPASVEKALDSAADAIREQMAAVVTSVPTIDPTLEGAARSTVARMEHDLATLRTKIIQAAKRRHETLRRQFIRVRDQAFPGGQPQERSVGFVYFLNQYGPALVDRIAAELPLGMGHHWVLTI